VARAKLRSWGLSVRSLGPSHSRSGIGACLRGLTLVVAATGAIDACGTAMIYFLERHAHGTEVQSVGQAFFFTTVQLLTVSSQIRNPITPAGRALDIALELWAVIVVAGAAGRSRPSSKTLTRSNLSLAGLAARSTSPGGAVSCGGGSPHVYRSSERSIYSRGLGARGLAWGEGNCGTPRVSSACAPGPQGS
jgi:hypothetical protein